MAESAYRLVPVIDAGTVEVWTVGIDPQASLGRVTAQTVRLLVTGNTTLQILPRRRRMAQDPEALIIVVRASSSAYGIQPKAGVAGAAECFRVMACAAIAGPAVGLRCVRGQKVHGVKGRGALTFVAANATALRVTNGAVVRGCGCGGPVPLEEATEKVGVWLRELGQGIGREARLNRRHMAGLTLVQCREVIPSLRLG